MSDYFWMPKEHFSALSWQEQLHSMLMFTLHWNNTLSRIFIVLAHWSNSPMGRHVAPLWHIILIQTKPVFALAPRYCRHSGEATNINLIVFGFTWLVFKRMIYHIRGKHANITHLTGLWRNNKNRYINKQI